MTNHNSSTIWGWAAAVGVVSFLILKFLLSYAFWPALLLAILIAILVAILIWLGFYRNEPEQVSSGSARAAAGAATAGAVSAGAATATGAAKQETAQDDAAAREAAAREAAEAKAAADREAAEKAAEIKAAAEREAAEKAAAERAAAEKEAAEREAAEQAAKRKALSERTEEEKRAAHEASVQRIEAQKRAAAEASGDYDGDGVVEGADEGTKPATLSAPREGGADDLKKIKGVGPKMELMLHSMGFYHFDQIAAWNASEVAWVNANLEGFKGRVTRDNWVEQANLLASGGETEFSKKVDKGGVY